MKVTLDCILSVVANPIPCFKGVHESIRSVMASMKTNLHMRVDYAQRDTSVECHASSITQRGTTIMVVFSEKRVCVFNACVNDKNKTVLEFRSE